MQDSSKEEKAANDNQQDIILKDLVQTAIKTERMIAVEAEGTSHQRKNTKTVGPNLYVALAAVHFKNHTSSGGANKPGLRQLKEAVYVYFKHWNNIIIVLTIDIICVVIPNVVNKGIPWPN